MIYRLILAAGWLLHAQLVTAEDAEKVVYRGDKTIRDGDLVERAVHVDLSDEPHPLESMMMLRRMPRLKTLAIGGPRFHAEHLRSLAKVTSLRVLVLDSVDLPDAALAEFQAARPEVVVLRSQRLAISHLARLAYEIAVPKRLCETHPEVRALLGDAHFHEATEVDFSRLPDLERGPSERILNEDLAYLRTMPTLTRLDLSWTRLNDGGMYYLRPLTKLEALRIPLDEVTADGLVHLQGMQQLKQFGGRFGRGRIDDAGMRHVAKLRALEWLFIDETAGMTDAGLEAFGPLQRLQTLELHAPRIEGAGLRHLAGLPALTHLVLGPGVKELTAIPAFPALRWLVLSGSAVRDQDLAPLANCRQLETVSLDRTTIGDAGVVHLAGLTGLQGVSLNETQVGDTGLAALRGLSRLRFLSLSGTRVSNAGLAMLRGFPELESVTIHDFPLDDEGIGHLAKLPKLKSLEATCRHAAYPDWEAREAANRDLRERLERAVPCYGGRSTSVTDSPRPPTP